VPLELEAVSACLGGGGKAAPGRKVLRKGRGQPKGAPTASRGRSAATQVGGNAHGRGIGREKGTLVKHHVRG
jgi:hypothetical protein